MPGGGGRAPRAEPEAKASPWHGVLVAVGQHAVDALINSAVAHAVRREEALRACRASRDDLAGLGVGERGAASAPSVVRPEPPAAVAGPTFPLFPPVRPRPAR